MDLFKPAGTVTGLYREDYNYSPTAACFNPYRDVYREHQPAGTESQMNDDSYSSRINQKKKDKN